MNSEITILLITTLSIGVVHTALGPDHYIPFIALSKANNWSYSKTSFITFICGLGHVSSSIIIGLAGIYIGVNVFSLDALESIRGNIAGWLLIIFGLLYTIWGIKQSLKNKTHTHIHCHSDGTVHTHTHNHKNEHSHIHIMKNKNLTPWLIFIIFVFGPCEPLIPLIVYPAVNLNTMAVIMVAVVFSVVTIAVMEIIVFLGIYGINFIPAHKLQIHIHTIAGLSILLCGIGVQFFGL